VILLPIGKFKDFSQIFSKFFHCSSQGRPNCGPKETRTKILRIIGSFGHFPQILEDSGPKKGRHFSSERKTRKRQKK
jgi:hypothetical protein